MSLHIGFPIFPDVTQLDFTGPWEVLTRLPGAQCHLIAESRAPVVAQGGGLAFLPMTTFEECPPLDIVCVPGGFGHVQAMESEVLIDFLRRQAESCRYITSVCTGSLILAAAGLLTGYRATTHWLSFDRLATFGAIPTAGRVVTDRNRITGGGVTAGIDFGLTLAATLAGEAVAKQIATQIEYVPAPPFSGDPKTASAETLAALEQRIAAVKARFAEVDARAIARLKAARAS